MTEDKKLNKNFIINFLQNWIIAVCENLEEAVYAWEKWASWILLVKERGWEEDDVFVIADEEIIQEVLKTVQIPVLVRVKFWHFWEAKICEELWVDWIVEWFQTENSLKEKLDENEFNFVIISEVFDAEKILDSNKNILILGDYATGNFNSIKENFLSCGKKFSKSWKNFWEEKNPPGDTLLLCDSPNIFLWWWISSVADLDVLQWIWNVKWFFIGSAIFDLDSREFFEDYWEYKKNIFG